MQIPLVQRLDFIKQRCAGRSVLHLGCADSPYTEAAIANGTLLHAAITDAAASVTGFDFDDAGLEKLRRAGYSDLYKADLEHLSAVDLDQKFDVIIAGEMIEHLNNPGLFLQGIKRFMSPSTDLIITTINAFNAMRFIRYGFVRGGGRFEPVHPDHVAYYSYSTLNLLVSRNDLAVNEFLFYDLGKDHRKTTPFIFRLLNDLGVLLSKQWADGIIAVCKLNGDSSD